MIVLSVFDGISCGRVALERAQIPVTNYYASETDKYASQVTRNNYPDTVQLGDIRRVKVTGHIDYLIGGSPCQGFSTAGKGLGFKDERSLLFFEYVRLLHEARRYNPNVKFLLENVKMKEQDRNIISSFLGVQPTLINSSVLSAQNRKRYYWFNWNILPPLDAGIKLKDIIENGFVDRDKAYCLDANYSKGGSQKTLLRLYKEQSRRQIIFEKPHGFVKGGFRDVDKFPTLRGCTPHNYAIKEPEDYNFRKLTPIEAERLQTLPDNYTAGISNTQRYKCLGNGWTVDVIAHILKFSIGV